MPASLLRNLWQDMSRRLEYRLLFCRNKPLYFPAANLSDGTPVGESIDVHHLALHDMASHQICGNLTRLLVREGLDVNAYRILAFERTDIHAITTIQPIYAEGITSRISRAASG